MHLGQGNKKNKKHPSFSLDAIFDTYVELDFWAH